MRRHAAHAVVCALVAAVLLAAASASALAGSTEWSGIQDDGSFQEPGYALNPSCTTGDPTCNIGLSVGMGSRAVRIIIYWAAAAPQASSCTVPSVDLTNIDNYNSTYVARVSNEITIANQRGLPVYLAFGGPFPCWASIHPDLTHCPNTSACTDEPNPSLFDAFVHAFAARFAPYVARWQPYNEPDNASFLSPQTTTSYDPYTGLMYRKLWYTAYNEIRTFSSAPVWFGDLAQNAHDSTSQSKVILFVDYAVCDLGTQEVSDNPTYYPSCTQTGPAPPTEALTFHFYGKSGLYPADHLTALNNLSNFLVQLQANGRFPATSFLAETEHGWQTSPNGVSATQQSINNTCDEEAAYKNHHMIGLMQYELQDPPPGRGGDLHTGLFSQSVNGSLGQYLPSYSTYEFPFAVYRMSNGALDVWGAVKPPSLPGGSVTVRGYNSSGSVVYSTTVSMNPQRFFHAQLTNAPTGLTWKAWTSDGFAASRVAGGSDCGLGWNGGEPS